MKAIFIAIGILLPAFNAHAFFTIDPNWKDCELPENEVQCAEEFKEREEQRTALFNSLQGNDRNEYICLVDPRSCGGGGGQ